MIDRGLLFGGVVMIAAIASWADPALAKDADILLACSGTIQSYLPDEVPADKLDFAVHVQGDRVILSGASFYDAKYLVSSHYGDILIFQNYDENGKWSMRNIGNINRVTGRLSFFDQTSDQKTRRKIEAQCQKSKNMF